MRLTQVFKFHDQESESPDGPASDRALVERIVRQDQAAMAALMARYQVRVFHFAMRYVGNRDLAEDIVREVFFAVWQSAPRFESRSSVSTWLLAIARYKAISARQRLGVPSESMTDELAATLVDSTDLPDAAIERRQSIELLRKCLTLLPPSDGALFDLVYYHDKSLREVAEIFGVPINTVKTRMARARRRLAALMAAEEAGAAREPVAARVVRLTSSPKLQPLDREAAGQTDGSHPRAGAVTGSPRAQPAGAGSSGLSRR